MSQESEIMSIKQSENHHPNGRNYSKVWPAPVTVTHLNNEVLIMQPTEENIKETIPEVEDGDEGQNEEHEDLEYDATQGNRVGNFIISMRGKLFDLFKHPYAKRVLLVIFFLLYPIYFGFVMDLNPPFNFPKYKNTSDNTSTTNTTVLLDDYLFANNRGMALLVLTVIVLAVGLWDIFLAKRVTKWTSSLNLFSSSSSLAYCIFGDNVIVMKRFGKLISWLPVLLVLGACILYLALDLEDAYNLISVGGIIAFYLIITLSSHNPSRINWRIAIVGLLIQFVLGVFLMRVEFGYKLFKFFGAQVTNFLEYTDKGSALVFGDTFAVHFFAFKALPVIVFFSAMINLLYYLGAIQYLILKLAWFINVLMGTSPTESMNATANIFLGQTEAPLLVKPFLTKMTDSELFSVMVGGFATVAGSVLAAYIGFGVPANHLIVASLMAAPGALAISKTMYPETKKTKASWDAIQNLPKGEANNIFEAISIGASNMAGPIGGIITNLIAFTAFFAFVDTTVAWFFANLNVSNFGLTSILQYIFWPFAFLMGVKLEDCEVVSKLIGIKIVVNEFVAYQELGGIIKFRNNQTIKPNDLYPAYLNGTFKLPSGQSMIWNDRSILIATYALCGFANFASIGIQIGGLSALAPSRFKTFAKFATKAMIMGNITNFVNACIAGLLFKQL